MADTIATVIGDLRHDGKGWILLSVAAGWFLSIGVRYTFPALLPFFREEFAFSLTLAGLLLSALWAAYAIGQFPGGILGDRIGEGNILVISTAISTIAVFFVSVATNVWILFLGTVAFGFATSLYGPIRFTILTDIYSDRAGTAVGLSHASGSVGNTVLPVFAAGIASYWTWRAGYGILIPAFIVITLALWLRVPSRTSPPNQSDEMAIRPLMKRIFSTIQQGGIPLISALQIIMVFISQAFTGFFPTYLIEVKDYTPRAAAILFGLYFGIGVLVQPLTGLSKDRYGSRITLTILVLFMTVGLITLVYSQSIVGVLVALFLISNRNGTGVVINTFAANAVYKDIKGAGLGFLRTCWILIGATSPFIVGYLGDMGKLTVAFLLLAGLSGTALILTRFIPDE